jgi:nucleoside-diphosphate-sugar epimerase
MDILTGGAGLLGSELAFQLVRSGQEICSLVRPTRQKGAQERQLDAIAALHPEAPLTAAQKARITVIAGDIRFPDLGLGAETVAALRVARPRFLWHCAADLRHDPRFERNILDTNVGGVENVAALAYSAGVKRLHHVGTAYVSPIRDGVACEEPLPENAVENARNLYERSKILGEAALGRTARVPYTIHRTTTLIGPGDNGHVAGTAAYFGVLRGLFYMREFLAGLGRGPQVLGGEGMPFRIPGNGSARINLVPVDVAVRDMIDIANCPEIASGSAFHIADGAPMTLCEHLALIAEGLGWSSISWTNPGLDALHPLERAFAELMVDFQGQYFGDNITYSIQAGGRRGVTSLSPGQMRHQIRSALAGFRADQRGLTLALYALRKRLGK